MTTKAERDAMRKHLDPKHILPEDYQPTRVSTLLSLLDAADELERLKAEAIIAFIQTPPTPEELALYDAIDAAVWPKIPEPPQPETTP